MILIFFEEEADSPGISIILVLWNSVQLINLYYSYIHKQYIQMYDNHI